MRFSNKKSVWMMRSWMIQKILEYHPENPGVQAHLQPDLISWIYSTLKNTTERPILSRILNEKSYNPTDDEIQADPEDPGVSRRSWSP